MRKILFAVSALVVSVALADVKKMPPVYTVPHELDMLLKAGHIQGACCSEQGVYLSHQLGIAKIG
jgi:hypothetical protein